VEAEAIGVEAEEVDEIAASTSLMQTHACHLWKKCTQISMKHLRVVYSNAYRIMHFISRNVSVCPHQVNH